MVSVWTNSLKTLWRGVIDFKSTSGSCGICGEFDILVDFALEGDDGWWGGIWSKLELLLLLEKKHTAINISICFYLEIYIF